MLYNSIYIYLYMYTGAPRLGSARRECYFCMSVACLVWCRVVGKSTARTRVCEDVRGKRFDGIKRLNCEREREIMFVSSNLLWMDFSATRMFTEGYRLVRWKEWGQKREKTEPGWFKCWGGWGWRGVRSEVSAQGCRNVSYNFAFSRRWQLEGGWKKCVNVSFRSNC